MVVSKRSRLLRTSPRFDRLLGKNAATAAAAAATNDDENSACYEINLDVIGRVARFVGTGRNDKNLMALLVAIGPTDSRRIRHDYLKGNDQYVVKCLRSCDNTMAPFGWANTTNSTRALNMMANCRPCFDRCRTKLLAWMEVNKDWRSRCTKTNLQKYRRPSEALEANLVFNNPAVAIELGLHDVYSYLIRDMGVDVCDTSYRGFTSDVASKHQNMDKFVYSQLIVALYKGDVTILQTILSSPTFRLSSSPWTSMYLLSEWDILKFAWATREYLWKRLRRCYLINRSTPTELSMDVRTFSSLFKCSIVPDRMRTALFFVSTGSVLSSGQVQIHLLRMRPAPLPCRFCVKS